MTSHHVTPDELTRADPYAVGPVVNSDWNEPPLSRRRRFAVEAIFVGVAGAAIVVSCSVLAFLFWLFASSGYIEASESSMLAPVMISAGLLASLTPGIIFAWGVRDRIERRFRRVEGAERGRTEMARKATELKSALKEKRENRRPPT